MRMESEQIRWLIDGGQASRSKVGTSEECHVAMNLWNEDTEGMLACLGGVASSNGDFEMSLDLRAHSALEKRLALSLEQGNGGAIPTSADLSGGVQDGCDLQLSLGMSSLPAQGLLNCFGSEIVGEEVGVRRGPGRPRKKNVQGEDSYKSGKGIVRPKRGPGRPRKRRRGRPRKVILSISGVAAVGLDASEDLVKSIG